MRKRRGFSYLELVVAMALFGIALSGTTRLVVMQSRQVSALEKRLNFDGTTYLVPSEDVWARKLGAATTIESVDPGPVYPAEELVTLIDNGDPGYTEIGPDWHDHDRTAYNYELRCNNDGGELAVALWKFTGLTPRQYRVFVTWNARSKQCEDAHYDVKDDFDILGIVVKNLEIPPSGEYFEGVPWEDLGVYTITSGILRVRVSDERGKIVADAVRFETWGNDVEVLTVQKSFDSGEATIRVSVTPSS